MIKSKMRTGGSTILSALLCVLIGMIIGFIVLVVLAYVDRNNTYQEHASVSIPEEYTYKDILKARNYLNKNDIDDDILPSLNDQFTVDDLKNFLNYIQKNKFKPSPDQDAAYKPEELAVAVSAVIESEDPETVNNAVSLFSNAVHAILEAEYEASLKKYEFTFGDVLNDAYEKGFKRVLLGGWYIPDGGPQMEVSNIAPLIMTGLSVAFAFKTGLFNIGAAGQYTLGAFGALYFALVLQWPWYLCILAAILFGAIWGAIPGFFKAYCNVNEVITSIMFNWLGLYMVNTIMYDGGNSPMYFMKESKVYAVKGKSPGSLIPDLGSGFFVQPASIAIFLAIFVAILLWVVLNKTTFGYELKACGYSKSAAKYAGINEKKNIIMSMAIAGALAGMGGALYYLAGTAQWNPQNSTALPAEGFNGISVALLASSSPIGSIFSAFFIAHISLGGTFMERTIFPTEVASIISGVIIYLCAFMMLFKTRIAKLFVHGKKGEIK